MIPSDQSRMIEQDKFTYSPLGKAFEKQIKTVKDQGKKQLEALKVLKPTKQKLIINEEDKNEIWKIFKKDKIIKIEDFVYEKNKYVCNFQQHETIRSFAKKYFCR